MQYTFEMGTPSNSCDVRELTGVLLAAGYARRFGADKLMRLLPDGTPVALASALALRAAVPRMLAVVRADNAPLLDLLARHGIATVVADNAAEGMGASLAQGIAGAPDAGGWLVALADMPLVRTATIERVAASLAGGASIAVPAYDGKRGHPVGFAARHGARLRELRGDEGARSILREHAQDVLQIECNDPGIHADIDDAADFARIAGALRGDR